MSLVVAVDFDGTIVEHDYPDIGHPVPGAFKWMKRWKKAGAKLILWTMRSDGGKDGDTLAQAVAFCKKRGIAFDGVNRNPTQDSWTSSPKAYAQVYVDDAAFGCPLIDAPHGGDRRCVDWEKVGPEILSSIDPG